MKEKINRIIRRSAILTMTILVSMSMYPSSMQFGTASASNANNSLSINAEGKTSDPEYVFSDGTLEDGVWGIDNDSKSISLSSKLNLGYEPYKSDGDNGREGKAKYGVSNKGSANGTSGSISNGAISWNITNGKLTLSGKGKTGDFAYNDNGYTAPWCAYKDKITSIVVGEGITEIGALAFADVNKAKSVSLPQSLTSSR